MEVGLSKKSVLITGGASNIGRAITLAFAAEGANITIGDIDETQAQRVAEIAVEKGASGVQVVKTDVTRLDDVRAMFAAAVEKFGTVDVLVNNVGWDNHYYFVETTPEFWNKVIQINFVGLLNCSKVALEIMIPKRCGAIVSIGSDASRQGEPREAVYAGAKAAMNAFIKTIARENGRFGIRCNVVCPGMTPPTSQDDVGRESMWFDQEHMYDKNLYERIANNMPLKKLGKPDDVASAVVFMASNELAGHVTGQVLSVSGGYSMAG
ncbi:MAG: SDR family oxidoreductase [Roseiarcus sp.]|jgi:NAD(P)-dependent dehydrogenase (short-subunit alcohol dehydrogenase family)